jgi:DNA repair protein RadC
MKTSENITSKLAEIRVSYTNPVPFSERLSLRSSNDAVDTLRAIYTDVMDHHERFEMILLNRANQVLGYHKVSEGGLAGTVVDPKIVFQVALKTNASSIILAHNHPSGMVRPSDADKRITQKLKECGTILDIPVLDHIIITSESYFSFADEGLL